MTISVTCYTCGADASAMTGGTDALKLRGWTEREPKGMLCPKCSGTAKPCYACGALGDASGICTSCALAILARAGIRPDAITSEKAGGEPPE